MQVTPLFAKGPLEADPVGVGVAMGAFSATALLLRPWSGRESDRRGRRPLLIAGALLAAAAIAAHIVTTDFAVLVALRLVLGVAEAMFFVAGFAMLADLAPPGRSGEALSFNSLALYLGIAFGPSIGERLLGIGGYQLAWVGAAALALLAAALSLRLPLTGRAEAGTQPPFVLIHRPVLGPSVALFAGVAAMAGFIAFVPIYGRQDLGMAASAPVLLVYGLVVVGSRILFAKVPDRVPPFRLATAALAAMTVGMAVAGLERSIVGLFIGAAVMAGGVAFLTPAVFAAVVSRIQPTERGAAFGTVSVFLDLAFAAGPVLMGLVVDAFDIPIALMAVALFPALGALGTLRAALVRRVEAAA
jgi:predicted MFS family arabinose efflux permease